jgi:small-conductance mechanosensitive channel
MVNGESAVETGRERLLESIRSIEMQTLIDMVLILFAAYILGRIVTIALSKFSEKMSRSGSVKVKMIIPAIKFGIYIIAVFYILREIFSMFGPEVFLLTGLVGAAIGFGMKDLFADFAGGVVVTFERPYQVGDKITIGNYYGEVTDIGLRATKLVTPDDDTVTVPNSLIFSEAVASGNYGDSEMMVVIDLYIASESDVKTAMTILKEVVVTSRYVYISRSSPIILLHKAFPFYTRLRARAYVNDLRDEFEFESDVHIKAWMEFKKNGIRSPQLHILSVPPVEERESSDSTRRNVRLNRRNRKDSKFNIGSQKDSEL